MVQIKWTRLAIDDLKEIHAYISRDSVKFAKIQVLRIRAKTKVLRKYPLAGKPVAEFKNNLYREVIEGRYRIIYKLISSAQVDILTIHHASRNLTERQVE